MRNGKYAARRTSGTKAFALMLALILVVGAAVGTTLAWLTAESGTVTNTFTVGKITIDLKEHKLVDGTLNTAETVTENKTYKVVPGATQPKDPFVTVNKGSEACYLYVTITNNMVINSKTVATVNVRSDWTVVETQGNTTLYRYSTTIDASNADVTKQVFTTVTYSGSDITKDNIGDLANKTIVLKAYAHQFANTTQTVADTAAKAWAFPTT